MNRELLEEAAEWMRDAEVSHRGMKIQREILLRKITATLAAPQPDAMEIVKQILTGTIDDGTGHKRLLKPTEAASLIEDYGKRVPRALMEDIYRIGIEWPIGSSIRYERMDAIAAKYGVKMEG